MTLSVRLHHRFASFTLDVAFQAPAGVTVLFGRSGCGKTTTMNAVAGIFRPDRGLIKTEERTLLDTENAVDLPPHRRNMGVVFQEGRLFPHLSVRKNLLYGRRTGHRRHSASDFDKAVDTLGLETLLDRRPRNLSGGEKQRVAIGRALLSDPSFILADEPLASLDEARKAEILPYFERLRDDFRVPILYVSHSAAEVARLATTVVALEEGRVLRQGPALDVLSDAAVTPAGIRAAGAVLHARVTAHHADGLSELSADGTSLFLPRVAQPVGARVRVRIAAQDVILSTKPPEGLSALNVFPSTIATIRAGDGPGALITLNVAAGRLLARVTQRSLAALHLSEGVKCHAIVKSLSVAPDDVSGWSNDHPEGPVSV